MTMNNGSPASNPAASSAVAPLECFRVLLCQVAVRDMRTGTWSFVNVIPQVTASDPTQLGKLMPFSVGIGVVGNGQYDLACSWLGEDGSSYIAGARADNVKVEGIGELVIDGFNLPPKPGVFMLMVEYKAAGSLGPWQKTSARCPIAVIVPASPASPEARA